jgi:hypothetical protein
LITIVTKNDAIYANIVIRDKEILEIGCIQMIKLSDNGQVRQVSLNGDKIRARTENEIIEIDKNFL